MNTQQATAEQYRPNDQLQIVHQEGPAEAVMDVLIPHDLLDQIRRMRDQMISACSNCSIPTCRSDGETAALGGCPDSKEIPKWLAAWNTAIGALKEDRNLVFRARVQEAWKHLSASPLTRVTGRICPAPCEGTQIDDDRSGCIENRGGGTPVKIKKPEMLISDLAWHYKWAQEGLQEKIPEETNGKRIAVVGSGPAGYAAAWQLVQDGYEVTVFEKDTTAGGLMTYGIPDIKLPQAIVSEEWQLLTDTGRVTLKTGKRVTNDELANFDDILWAVGKQLPMELVDNDGNPIEGRESEGVGYAMDFLRGHQAHRLGETEDNPLTAQNKSVLVLGAGDTAEDTVHTANLHSAQSVQMAIRKPEAAFIASRKYPTAYSPEQIGPHERHYGTVITKIESLPEGRLRAHFITTGPDGNTQEWQQDYDLILNAYGFQKALEPEMEGVTGDITRNTRGHLAFVDDAMVAGDAAHMSATIAEDLVVTAVSEGVQQAKRIHAKHFPSNNSHPVINASPL